MIVVTVQGKKRQKKINLTSILNNMPDINVVCTMPTIDENFLVNVKETYMPHMVVVDFETPLKVRMDFFDVLSLLKFKISSLRIILIASKTSVESFGKDTFYKNLENAKIHDCIVSDDNEFIEDRLKKIINSPSPTEFDFIKTASDDDKDEEPIAVTSLPKKRNTLNRDLEDVQLNSNIFTDDGFDFNSDKVTYTDPVSDMTDYPQAVIGVTAFKDDDFSLAYCLEMAYSLKSYGSVCICSSHFEALRKYHSIKEETSGISYKDIDIYPRNMEDVSKYRFVIREILKSEDTQADFYILVCSAYEWELPDLQEYINSQKEKDINYVFTHVDKDRFLSINKILHKSGRKAFRLESSENPFEPCPWNIDTYSCIFSRYIPCFNAKKGMYKKKGTASSLLHSISLFAVMAVLVVFIVYICIFINDNKIQEYEEPTEPFTENTVPYDFNKDGHFDITDISFLQGLLSSGTGSEKPAEITEPTTQPETPELTTEAETTTNEVTQ